MELYGSLEDKEQINLRIRLTELIGVSPLLEMLYLRQHVVQSHGTELYG
jgi:hypothetical protein